MFFKPFSFPWKLLFLSYTKSGWITTGKVADGGIGIRSSLDESSGLQACRQVPVIYISYAIEQRIFFTGIYDRRLHGGRLSITERFQIP